VCSRLDANAGDTLPCARGGIRNSVTLAPDSSIAIAALITDHEAHDVAERALAECTATIAHVAVETYSVLTRLPPPHRLDAATAAELIARRLPCERFTLDADCHAGAPLRLAGARVSGGATYDGLIALTALQHDLEIVSRDGRAERTYRSLGARLRLLT
jgi:predicted nucleic acid-binding protein